MNTTKAIIVPTILDLADAIAKGNHALVYNIHKMDGSLMDLDVDAEGNKPIMLAVMTGDPFMTRIVAERSSNINVQNKRGHTPMDMAKIIQNNKVKGMLRKSGAK